MFQRQHWPKQRKGGGTGSLFFLNPVHSPCFKEWLFAIFVLRFIRGMLSLREVSGDRVMHKDHEAAGLCWEMARQAPCSFPGQEKLWCRCPVH